MRIDGIDIEIEKKPIKNAYIRVYPENGRVKINAPQNMTDSRIHEFAKSRIHWIKKHLEKKPEIQVRTSFTREYMLEKSLPYINTYCAALNKSLPEIRFRIMRSRWGSCHPVKEKITLNALLFHLPEEFLEYVIAHELCHLQEANHGPKFYALMDSLLPDWKSRRAGLKRFVFR